MPNTHDVAPHESASALARSPSNGALVSAPQNPPHPGHEAASAHRRALYAATYGHEGKENEALEHRRPSAAEGNAPESDETSRALYAPPSNPKEYRFESAPHGVPYDTELDQKARGWFYKAGVPQWLACNIVSEWNRTVVKGLDPERTAGDAAATERSLRQRWGDKYEVRIAAAQTLIRSLKSDEVMDLLDRSGLANSEYLVRQLVALTESRPTQNRA